MLLSFIGLLLPPIIDLINKHYRGDELKEVRFLYALGVCVVIGVAVDAISSNLFYRVSLPELADRIVAQILTIFSMSQISYTIFYKDSFIRKSIVNQEEGA